MGYVLIYYIILSGTLVHGQKANVRQVYDKCESISAYGVKYILIIWCLICVHYVWDNPIRWWFVYIWLLQYNGSFFADYIQVSCTEARFWKYVGCNETNIIQSTSHTQKSTSLWSWKSSIYLQNQYMCNSSILRKCLPKKYIDDNSSTRH